MKITHINDIPICEYPVFISMIENSLVRFSKWECAKYWEKRGVDYYLAMKMYEKYIGRIDELIYKKSCSKSVA